MKKNIWLVLFLALSGSAFAAATSQQYLDAGNQFYRAKDMSKAVQYYKAAIQVDPNNAAAHQSLGSAYYSMGQKSEALAEYQKALAINPNNPQLSSFVQTLQSQGVAPSASYPSASPSSSSAKSLEINLGLGVASGGGSGMGIGGGASGYFLLDKSLGIGGALGAYMFSPYPGYSLMAIEALVSGKYYFDGQGIKPYLLAGVGMSMLSDSSVSVSNPVVQGGVGASLDLGGGLTAFGELKYSYIISPLGVGSYIPINIGLSFGM
jgi:tetratricopeptide (TPR) repeat protein